MINSNSNRQSFMAIVRDMLCILKQCNIIHCDQEIFDWVDKIKNTPQSTKTINFVYFGSFMKAFWVPEYRQVLLKTDLLLLDGIAMQILSYFVLFTWPNNINGTDVLPKIIKFDKLTSWGLIGAQKASLDLVVKKISKFKQIKFSVDGYSSYSPESLAGCDAVLICKGSPLQEIEAYKLAQIKLPIYVVITGGGFFDFYSDQVSRAPLMVRRAKFEWLYRCVIEPHRFKVLALYFWLPVAMVVLFLTNILTPKVAKNGG